MSKQSLRHLSAGLRHAQKPLSASSPPLSLGGFVVSVFVSLAASFAKVYFLSFVPLELSGWLGGAGWVAQSLGRR